MAILGSGNACVWKARLWEMNGTRKRGKAAKMRLMEMTARKPRLRRLTRHKLLPLLISGDLCSDTSETCEGGRSRRSWRETGHSAKWPSTSEKWVFGLWQTCSQWGTFIHPTGLEQSQKITRWPPRLPIPIKMESNIPWGQQRNWNKTHKDRAYVQHSSQSVKHEPKSNQKL